MHLAAAEYIWLDGQQPTQGLRSKTRILGLPEHNDLQLHHFVSWSFDGSSTQQSSGHHSDVLLQPVCFCQDPLRGPGNYLVLCEVFCADGSPHPSNSRSMLREVLHQGATEEAPWFGFEQEYVLMQHGRPLGFPEHAMPPPQGPYYCSVGCDVAFGRPVVEAHMKACMEAGLMFYGVNAEVMPGQWEFQMGYRGVPDESGEALKVCDHMQFARWLMLRISEAHQVVVSWENKPMQGDWNGSGCHTNFSTRAMRDPQTGMRAVEQAVARLQHKHQEHVAGYGAGLAERLTGDHETCSMQEFVSGVGHRGASVRIPQQVFDQGWGYLEDRRPGANCDPYWVAARILATLVGLEDQAWLRATASTANKEEVKA